jgi:hypothetical protein
MLVEMGPLFGPGNPKEPPAPQADLTPPERAVAQVEGWILGVPGLIRERDLDHESQSCTTLK